jgi:hypothetical protein
MTSPNMAPKTSPRTSWSGDRTNDNSRLVKRFTTDGRLHVHLRLGGRGPAHSRPTVAEVTDVSITGVLVQISGSLRVRQGATVTLGDGPSTAVCRVAHARVLTGTKSQQLGLEIVEQTDEFRRELSLAVGALRKDRGQVLAAWEHPN